MKRQEAPSVAQRRVFIRTFGCQMNEYDSRRMLESLRPEYTPVSAPEDADLIILNTCSVREKAEVKVYSLAGRLKHLKRRRPDLIIAVCGCVAQQEGQRLVERMPHIDIVLGPQGIYRLREALAKVRAGEGPVVDTDIRDDFCLPSALSPEVKAVKAFVTIMQGCNNYCSYCVVPYVRGPEISRRPGEILAEIRALVSQGVREVTLLGQNVNSYGKRQPGFPTFAQLLERVAQIDGLWRLRFTTSHPKDLSPELMRAFVEIPILCEHLHLPVQSGSDRILAAMNRGYRREDYLKKVERLRELVPEIALTTDIIVGFPGEREEDFQATLDLLKEVEFDEIFSFKYSDRPFARARSFPDKVPEEVKEERLATVHNLQLEISRRRYRRLVGQEVEVLVEGRGKSDPRQWTGRTRQNTVVNFYGGQDLTGKLVKVLVEEACQHSVRGRLVGTLH
ncbi:tRNA (N6-isopentenyl adenosine(37)-C2)-methylthiotransferase MiaB [Thermosulfuriphilus ammonigenes]|uniref:tRNA-2-methylthio-N(6)-dimethylallyladenosine synthase n=2 Tax=Thermosulfuriphilus ammonigenes TaxID=1936021 RepID=A0A6G7PYQ6_9BACT|nr:tRNA (N6-isopentenyl adenosine(37)-C2)-methylthiotransferase MiaB [Thermosulfuriphilus ammonigenes]MBA2848759.1 tRNA-2-methylthio-N6-dimethylallyladenosine synthase [Thermosulfuriphilus ammonigenes]QIJ72824.1 tRNA (N6-isopentenyl adenosine(37)-C2)-methylthiotransferase MiaB [Thermosulfuriphilus ammonigenes]